MSIESVRVTDETLKLLLQVAYGDHHLSPAEARFIRAVAGRTRSSDAFRTALPDWLAGRAPLPPPDLGLLRRYRAGCLAMVELVARADGFVCEAEHDLVAEISAILDADPPRAP